MLGANIMEHVELYLMATFVSTFFHLWILVFDFGVYCVMVNAVSGNYGQLTSWWAVLLSFA